VPVLYSTRSQQVWLFCLIIYDILYFGERKRVQIKRCNGVFQGETSNFWKIVCLVQHSFAAGMVILFYNVRYSVLRWTKTGIDQNVVDIFVTKLVTVRLVLELHSTKLDQGCQYTQFCQLPMSRKNLLNNNERTS
jgi:hypothetical protein